MKKLILLSVIIMMMVAGTRYQHNAPTPKSFSEIKALFMDNPTVNKTFSEIKAKITENDTVKATISNLGSKVTEKVSGKPTIKIGISLPLTGKGAYSGMPVKEGVLMALEEWNNKDTKYNYKLIIEDDKHSKTTMQSISNKLLTKDNVNALISIWNLSTSKYRESVKKAKIPYLTCSWGNNTSDGILSFNNQTPHSEHVRVLIEALRKSKAKKVALIGVNRKADKDLHKQIEQGLKKSGIKLVTKKVFENKTQDYRMIMPKLKVSRPDVIISLLTPNDLSTFTKQLREANITTPQTSIDYFASVKNKAPFEGSYFVKSSSGTPQFKQKLAERINFEDSDCLASGYDNLNLLIKAFEKAPTTPGKIPSTAAVVKELHKIRNYPGAIGKLTVKPDGRIFSKAYLAQIKNGKAVVINN